MFKEEVDWRRKSREESEISVFLTTNLMTCTILRKNYLFERK